MDTENAHVVVSSQNADAKTYVTATVHPSEESANEYLAEIEAAKPWQSHKVLSREDFDKTYAESNDDATETD